MKLCPLCETVYPSSHTTCGKKGCGARLVESRQLEPGTVIREKYRIERFIGRGGMGTVYLAEHIHLNERHALKFISGELTHDPKVLKRFRQEAQALRRLIDHNIVTVYDLDQADDGSFYIAMEFVAGLGLREVISAGPLPVARAIAIARGVASGLAAAHAKQIIHRDIKPDNILLDHSAFQTTGIETPKLLDFGIAAVKETSTAMSRTRGFMLTPEYAAPEQWMGLTADQIDGRTDLYALGGVLDEMLTGTTCLHSTTPDGWMYQHLQAERTAPSQKRPELANWPGLDALVLSLFAKDRDHRPANATAFIEELDKLNQKPSAKSYKTNQATAIEAKSEYLQKFHKTLSSKPDVVESEIGRKHKKYAFLAIALGAIVLIISTAMNYPWQNKSAATTQSADSTPAPTIAKKTDTQPETTSNSHHRESSGPLPTTVPKPDERESLPPKVNPSVPPKTVVIPDQKHTDPSPPADESKLVWTDPATGTIWEKRDNGVPVNAYQAATYCQGLNLAGHSDWRLPIMKELRSIYDANASVPCIGLTCHIKEDLIPSASSLWSSDIVTPSG